MPTCSIDGVHPSILSIMGGIEVAEAIKVIMGKKLSLSDKILHVDIETMDFTSTRTFRAEECPICGTDKLPESVKEELILEELCGRNQGKRTFSITPTTTFVLDVNTVTGIAKNKGFLVENQGEFGLSLRTNDMSVSFMKKGSAVIVGPKDETDTISLYKMLLGKEITTNN
jgi:molybdopterin-synthase adenylyltransferase